jgi:hypothetical protein
VDGELQRLLLLDARRVPWLAFAPRLDPRLHRRLARLDRATVPIAETHRRLCVYAWSLGLFRPSYEHVRRLVHALRMLRLTRARRRHTTAALLVEVAYNLKPPSALVDHALDAGPYAPP